MAFDGLSRSLGRVFLAPFDVVFTRWDVVEPDLLFVAGDQADILTDKNVQGAPALVIEVLSPGTRQVGIKSSSIQATTWTRIGRRVGSSPVRRHGVIEPE